MSDLDSHPEDGLDPWLAAQHHKLVTDIAATLDVEGGLREALIPTHHANLVADLDQSLDIEAGLAAIVPTTPDVRPPNGPLVPNQRPADAEHVAATSPGQAETIKLGRSHNSVIAAIAAAILMILTIPTSASPPSATTLSVLDYGVTAQPRVGTMIGGAKDTVVFILTIRASGSGTLRNTWRLGDNHFSHQPVRTDTITFTGPAQTQNVVYSIPHTCSRGQRLQGGMIVEITTPEFPLGKTSDYYDFTCQ